MRGHFSEAVGTGSSGEGNEGIVSKMHEIAGEHGAGARADVRKRDTDKDKNEDDSPGPGKLGSVKQTKGNACDEDAARDAAAKSLCGVHAEKPQNGGGDEHDDGVEIAAKNGVLD